MRRVGVSTVIACEGCLDPIFRGLSSVHHGEVQQILVKHFEGGGQVVPVPITWGKSDVFIVVCLREGVCTIISSGGKVKSFENTEFQGLIVVLAANPFPVMPKGVGHCLGGRVSIVFHREVS